MRYYCLASEDRERRPRGVSRSAIQANQTKMTLASQGETVCFFVSLFSFSFFVISSSPYPHLDHLLLNIYH
jgi:hypothetical protein